MLNLLAGLFIKDSGNVKDDRVRRSWGLLCSIYTIILNVAVFAAKYVTGIVSGSVSIVADSFNNLSDAGSSILILFGFRFAGMKPTPERPFGHGRIEYITGMIVSAMILVVGFTTLRDAIDAIIHPEDVTFSIATVVILVLSIAVKFYMALYGKRVGKKIDSAALRASAAENMTDTISTALTLAALLLNHFFSWKLDGWAALIVSALLIKAGIENGWDTLKELLGKKADPDTVREVYDVAMSYPEIIGVHDLIIHDYGPGRLYITLHCEVDGEGDIYAIHDAVDRCMEELDKKMGGVSVIHIDPIDTSDGRTPLMREQISDLLKREIDERVTVHDFRVVFGPTHDNAVFDLVVPRDCKMTEDEIEAKVKFLVSGAYEHPTYAVVKIDRPFA